MNNRQVVLCKNLIVKDGQSFCVHHSKAKPPVAVCLTCKIYSIDSAKAEKLCGNYIFDDDWCCRTDDKNFKFVWRSRKYCEKCDWR